MVARLLIIFCGLFAFLPSQAMSKAIAKEGLVLPVENPAKIVVFRPDVQVGTMTVGGVDEPNPDWTADARKFMMDSFKANQIVRDHHLTFLEDPQGEDGAYVAEYKFLFRAVADAIMQHKIFIGMRLPTKKTHNLFDWTLGKGAARLGVIGGADYALFYYTHDAYGSAARKTAQLVASMFGVAIIPGVHIGYAALVDLKTGDVVWFNADPQMGGDVRDSVGADKRVGQLLAGFPARGAVAKAESDK